MNGLATLLKPALSSIALATVVSVLITGCATPPKREASQEPQSPETIAQLAENKIKAERSEYINQVQGRLEQLGQHSQDMRATAITSEKDKGKKLENAAEDLDSMLTDVKKNLAEVRTATPANWIDYKRDVDKALLRAETHYSNTQALLR